VLSKVNRPHSPCLRFFFCYDERSGYHSPPTMTYRSKNRIHDRMRHILLVQVRYRQSRRAPHSRRQKRKALRTCWRPPSGYIGRGQGRKARWEAVSRRPPSLIILLISLLEEGGGFKREHHNDENPASTGIHCRGRSYCRHPSSHRRSAFDAFRLLWCCQGGDL
jgi:hypothetical protein